MKCIKCGQSLVAILEDETHTILQYECVNPNCTEFQKPWSIAEHKDNQEWSVRHTRNLEQRVQQLEAALEQILQKLGV